MWMPPLYRDFANRAQIDAQYGTQRWVPDPGRRSQGTMSNGADMRARACAAPGSAARPHVRRNARHLSADQSGAPVFIFVHGGYWRANTAKEFSCVVLGLQPLGITTVVVNYALRPKVTIDEITRQARAATAWCCATSSVTAGPVARRARRPFGRGAYPTAMALQTRWTEEYGLPEDPLAAAVLVSGIYDIQPLRYSYLQPQIQLDDGIVLGTRHSPASAAQRRPSLPGAAKRSDEFRRQSSAFHAAWQKAGNAGARPPRGLSSLYGDPRL